MPSFRCRKPCCESLVHNVPLGAQSEVCLGVQVGGDGRGLREVRESSDNHVERRALQRGVFRARGASQLNL